MAYASLLSNGSWAGLGILVAAFVIYISGVLPNVVDFDKLQIYWKLRASEYIHQANSPTGWQWLNLLNNGDMLNFIGIAVLAGITVICYLRIIPIFIRKKTRYILQLHY